MRMRVTDRSLAGSQNGFTVLKNTKKDTDKTEEYVDFNRRERIPYFCREMAITEQLDNCVTSAGVFIQRVPFRNFINEKYKGCNC